MADKRFMAAYLLGVSFLPSLLPAVLYAQDLPIDPNVVAGDVTISNPSDSLLLMQQASQYGIVDWGSFSIGTGFGVQVNNGTGATLNRVTGGDLSSIMGSLNATGSVYLINPNGIVVGKTGVVNTGGRFVATTLDMSDTDFLNGGDATFGGTSDAYVINLGTVSSLGGDVALLARHVVNEGTLSAPNGTVGMVAGREILMRDAAVADGLFSVKVGGADTSASDAGAIRAAAAELRAKGGNVYALAGNTEGTIEATGVAKVAGRVFLTAGDGGKLTVQKAVKARNADGSGGAIAALGGTVDMAGTLDASGTAGGTVVVKADGEAQFDGQIFAKGGEGGFVEVSGGHISFAGDVDAGGGTLLIDPDNIEITANNANLLFGNALVTTSITPTTIEGLLASQDVVIETLGANGEAGTLAVTRDVSWTSANSLTLLATGDILFNASVQNSGDAGGDLNVVAGWDGTTGAGTSDLESAAFDASVFDAADLASQTLFGNATGVAYTYDSRTPSTTDGSVYLGDPSMFSAVAVGSKTGTTRVYARNVVISGATGVESGGAFAQLGFNVNGSGDFGTVSGDINVRASNDIRVLGGSPFQTAAQIGHGGINRDIGTGTATVVVTGAINATALRNIVIDPGSDGARIGHSGGTGTATTSMTAGAFYTTAAADGAPAIDVAMLADDTGFGDVRVTTTASDLSLIGFTSSASCECGTISSPGSLIVQTSGDLILGTAALADFSYSNDGGGNLVLAAGGNVINNAGAGAIGPMGPGQWIIYSDRPDHDVGTLGTLTPDDLIFGTPYDAGAPLGPVGLTRNALVYRQTPVVTVADAALTYGDTYVPGAVTLTMESTGEVILDPATWGLTLGAAFVDDGVASFSGDGFVNAGGYTDALKTDISPPSGVTATNVLTSFGDLTVNRATVTVALADQSRIYDGTSGYTLLPTYSGWIGTDDAGLISAGPVFGYAGGDGSAGLNATTGLSPYTVSASGLAESSGNYTFDTTDTASLTITQRALSASILGSIDKTYDGTADATLTAADFDLTGFVSGESATVTQTLGSYETANAGVELLVTANLGSGDFSAGAGTLLSNYVLPSGAEGFGTIDRKGLAVSIIGTPTKTYDGTADAALTEANFDLTGFVTGEGAAVTQTLGSYETSHAGAGLSVQANLAAGDFAATSGTLLSNYILPDTATGVGAIDQLALSVSLVGSIDKTYDGTTDATLTASDFDLTGFVSGETASVTQTQGTYADANAANGLAVQANLGAGDFAAGSGTLLSDYALPTTASGFGNITQRALSASIIGTPTKTYDGTADATLTAADFDLTGFVSGESATVTQTLGSYETSNAGVELLVTANLGSGDFSAGAGTLLSNYVLPSGAEGFGNIDRKGLAVSIIGTPTKTYDGTADAALTEANFDLTGFVTGEGAAVTQTLGSYETSHAGAGLSVQANLAAGDFAATSGTLLSNYILPDTATGVGTIDQRALSVSLVGSIDKTYDGTTDAALTASDFDLTGFVSGETASVTQTQGTYADANAANGLAVQANLGAGDFAAGSRTLLSDYALPTTASGFGNIAQRALTASIIGTPTKTYDGTAIAALTEANFDLTGFVTGQGAAVTQTLGSYETAHAGTGWVVQADLAAGDFAANAGTSLSNYVLPVSASGFGDINRKDLAIGIIGTPTKQFDGTTLIRLDPSNFEISGFVLNDSAIVTQTTGQFGSTAPGSQLITASLMPDDLAASGTTDLTNYNLPSTATATGRGLIAPVPVDPPLVTPGVDPFPTTPLGDPSGPADVLQVINTETTQQILDEINAGANFCREFVQQEYAIDCLSDRLQSVADGLSTSGEYSEVRAALEDAARKLHALAMANASSVLTQTVARSTSGPNRSSSRPLTAISADSLLTANAEARAIIASTEVVLLRSGADSARRRVAFQQVGQIVGSTATLLRSS